MSFSESPPTLRASVIVAAFAGMLTATTTPAYGQSHGVNIQKGCDPSKAGFTVSCIITITPNDEFGDTLEIVEAFDIIALSEVTTPQMCLKITGGTVTISAWSGAGD